MSKLTKILSLILCIAMLTCVLASCGEDSQNSQKDDYSRNEQNDKDNNQEKGTKGLSYTLLPDGTYSVSGGETSSLAKIVIPSKYNDKAVTQIAKDGFYNYSKLKEITIPDSITYIGSCAFEACYSLKYNEYDNAKYLGNQKNKYLYLRYADEKTTKIHESTKIIGELAFWDCENLTSIKIPDGVTYIGHGAFEDCLNLKDISIPDSIMHIANNDFSALGYLNYYVYDNARYLGNENNNFVCLVQAEETTTKIHESTKIILENAFEWNSTVSALTIPEGVTSIGDSAFIGCSKLRSITIPNSVTYIGNSAFDYCTALTSITIPNSITYISDMMFEECHILRNVNIPDSIVSIGNMAFASCWNLESIIIPSSVTSIGENAFYDCSDLKTVYYYGTQENWNNILIHNSVKYFLEQFCCFYSENEPTESGNYWRYVNGTPKKW